MFNLKDLDIPVVAAPMAGGPSTPELVAAVGAAGGLGFLAAGSRAPKDVAAEVSRVRELGHTLFGVNVSCPPDSSSDPSGIGEYSRLLRPLALTYGLELPVPEGGDDDWSAKIELLAALQVPVVSFTFGIPDDDAIGALHWAGAFLLATVTSPGEARAAAAAGMDALVVQGPAAGGHQSTHRIADEPNTLPLPALLHAVRAVTDLPLVAAGGITDSGHAGDLIAIGAQAIQAGTAFMLTPEAGTSSAVRTAYGSPEFTRTVMTRAFTGRYARGLANRFTAEFSAAAPAAYPEVNSLTAAMRNAAARRGNVQHTHVWAGTGWRNARAIGAAEVVGALTP